MGNLSLTPSSFEILKLYRQSLSPLLIRQGKKFLDKSNLFSVNEFQLSTDVTINLLKMKNKNYYWLLIKNAKDKHILKGSEKWKRDLQSDATVIDSFFSRVRHISRDNKLREFLFQAFAKNSCYKTRTAFLWSPKRHALHLLSRERLPDFSNIL